jgi:hypothetical protein
MEPIQLGDLEKHILLSKEEKKILQRLSHEWHSKDYELIWYDYIDDENLRTLYDKLMLVSIKQIDESDDSRQQKQDNTDILYDILGFPAIMKPCWSYRQDNTDSLERCRSNLIKSLEDRYGGCLIQLR